MPRPGTAGTLTAALCAIVTVLATHASAATAVLDPHHPASEPAPRVVTGRHGYLFFGPFFDQACDYGAHLQQGFRHLNRLAETIAASGRRVVFTVAPDNTQVATREVPRAHPHGGCATRGFRAQRDLLDSFDGRYYLPLRAGLVADRRQTYWRTDPHWTANGGADFSQALARRLRPALAAGQRDVEGDQTQLGIYNEWLGVTAQETARVARPADPETVVTAPSSQSPWSGTPRHGRPTIVVDHSWTTAASARPFPGRTVLIGDSFTLYALGTLRPLFRHGRFLWFSSVDRATVLQAVQDSRTVVIEVAQFLVQHAPIGTAGFRHDMAVALDVDQRGRGRDRPVDVGDRRTSM